MCSSGWNDLHAPADELRLAPTLLSGMSFRWRLTSANTFIGVVRDRICELRETAAGTEFRVHGPPARADDVHAASAALRAHLSLDRGPRTPAAKWASPQHALKDSVLPAVAVQQQLQFKKNRRPVLTITTFLQPLGVGTQSSRVAAENSIS